MTLALGDRRRRRSTLQGVDGSATRSPTTQAAERSSLIQSCNHCPYVHAWEGRIAEIQSEYADRGVQLVAINSNDAEPHPEDCFELMVRPGPRSRRSTFDYLHDEDQSVARALGSERTPEVFVFDRDRASRLPRRAAEPRARPPRARRRRRPGRVAGVPARRARRPARRTRAGTCRDPAPRLLRQVGRPDRPPGPAALRVAGAGDRVGADYRSSVSAP